MVKLKNVTISKSPTQNNSFKAPSEEPDGMTEIDLHEIINCTPVGEDVKNPTRCQKRWFLKLLVFSATGFVITTCISLTLLLMNDSMIAWPKQDISNPGNTHFKKSFIVNELNVQTNTKLNKLQSAKQNNISEYCNNQHKTKRDVLLLNKNKKPRLDYGSGETETNKNLISGSSERPVNQLTGKETHTSSKNTHKFVSSRFMNTDSNEYRDRKFALSSSTVSDIFEPLVELVSGTYSYDSTKADNSYKEDDFQHELSSATVSNSHDFTADIISATVSTENQKFESDLSRHTSSNGDEFVSSSEKPFYAQRVENKVNSATDSNENQNQLDSKQPSKNDKHKHMLLSTTSLPRESAHVRNSPTDSSEYRNYLDLEKSDENEDYQPVSSSSPATTFSSRNPTRELHFPIISNEGKNQLGSKQSNEDEGYELTPLSTTNFYDHKVINEINSLTNNNDYQKQITSEWPNKNENYEHGLSSATASYPQQSTNKVIFAKDSSENENHLGSELLNKEKSYEILPLLPTTNYQKPTSKIMSAVNNNENQSSSLSEDENYELLSSSTTDPYFQTTTKINSVSSSNKGENQLRPETSDEDEDYELVPSSPTPFYSYSFTSEIASTIASKESEIQLGSKKSDEDENYDPMTTTTADINESKNHFLPKLSDANEDHEVVSPSMTFHPGEPSSEIYSMEDDKDDVSQLSSNKSGVNVAATDSGQGKHNFVSKESDKDEENEPISSTTTFYSYKPSAEMYFAENSSDGEFQSGSKRSNKNADYYFKSSTATSFYLYKPTNVNLVTSDSVRKYYFVSKLSDENENYKLSTSPTSFYLHESTNEISSAADSNESGNYLDLKWLDEDETYPPTSSTNMYNFLEETDKKASATESSQNKNQLTLETTADNNSNEENSSEFVLNATATSFHTPTVEISSQTYATNIFKYLTTPNPDLYEAAVNTNEHESSRPVASTPFTPDLLTETTSTTYSYESENALCSGCLMNSNNQEEKSSESVLSTTISSDFFQPTAVDFDSLELTKATFKTYSYKRESSLISKFVSNAHSSEDKHFDKDSVSPTNNNSSYHGFVNNTHKSNQFEIPSTVSVLDAKDFSNSTVLGKLNYSNKSVFVSDKGQATKSSSLRLSRVDRNYTALSRSSQLQKKSNVLKDNVSGERKVSFGTTTLSSTTISFPATETSFTATYLPLEVRWSNQNSGNFDDIKNTEKDFAVINERVHTSQQSNSNQNIGGTLCPTFISPMGFPVVQQPSAFPYFFNPNQATPYANVMPFPVPRTQTSSYIAQQFPFSGVNLAPSFTKAFTQQGGYVIYNANGQNIIAPSPGGQYYICNPLPNLLGKTSSDAVPEIEIRNSAEDVNLQQQSFASDNLENKTRSSRDCPYGERSCEDSSKCIKIHHFCDGEVQCKDASDEAFCPCKYRIGKLRKCDGYFDCPNGEDELKCFGCGVDMFSCDDWSPNDRIATCILREQRCDGIPQCPTGKDELECSILTETLSEKQHFMVSTTVGFLYRNFKGRWYPACRNPELWANEACQSVAGPSTMAPLTHLVPVTVNYNGPYVSASAKENFKIVESCEAGAAVFVECPPLVCGMRKKIKNPYRMEEVDTSAEEILSQFAEESSEANNSTDDILGYGRVVGGRPSQPEAWPWIVSVYRNGVFHCGGVLINEFWIVTAGHCVEKYWHYYFEIQAGVLRRFSYAPMVQNRVVSHVIAHGLYDRTKLKNDLALMRMVKPIKFGRYVRPICLPSEITAGQNFKWGPEPGTVCTAVGWGATVEHGSDPDHLREVDVPVLKHCKHREDQEGHEICAGLMEGGKDACQGDSGGPFMCRNPNAPNQWYLAGIVSHGEGCARPNEPGVYTRVSLFLDWIFENIRAEILPQTGPLNRCPGYICRKTKRCIANKRHCNKIVDCLLADDEMHCDRNAFNEIFKHAMRHMLFRSKLDDTKNNDTASLPVTELNEEEATDVALNETSPYNLKNISRTVETSTIAHTTTSTLLGVFPSTECYNQKFVCKRMLQTIEISKRCDRNTDCEDATDEEGCSCKDYLKHSHPEAICDGITDCRDMSDEENCGVCKQNEYHCRQSNICITNEKRCNNVPDCPLEEDELDCFALTNGKTVMVDGDLRPYLNSSGLVTFNHNGTWRVVCGNWTDTEATLAADICFYLGFGDYKNFLKASVYDIPLRVVQETSAHVKNTPPADAKHPFEHANISKATDSMNGAPWNADIYVEGKFSCKGVILENDWVITSNYCFEEGFKLVNKYVAVLLGEGKSYLNIVGPHEQAIRVTESIQVTDSDIILLRLNNSISFSRYIRPLRFNVRDYFVSVRETCFAAGRNSENFTESVLLQAVANCSYGFRCFKRTEAVGESCQNKNFSSWSGTIVCQSKHGWYPAAVFHESRGSCGFITSAAYTSVQYWRANILNLRKQAPFTVDAPPCKGFRCDLGNCIEDHKICDGIPDCRDAGDEDGNYCEERRKRCEVSLTCVCLQSQLKCHNGKCIPKTAFCDKSNDCGDWSDEPDSCTCSSYLALTNPVKICDGIRNCQDRTDEDPYVCKCKGYHFICGGSDYCVPYDMVCDGVLDCPNGQDEAHCVALTSHSRSSLTEVQVRTAGVWHPGCFPKSLTTLELENVCEKIGYVGGSAARLNAVNDSLNKTGWRAETDPFIGIWIHTGLKKNLMIGIRSGTNRFLSLTPDPECYRLFLRCL